MFCTNGILCNCRYAFQSYHFFLLGLYTGTVEYSQNNIEMISNETHGQRPDVSSMNKLVGSQDCYDYL